MPRLKRAADTTFDDRSRGQIMADTLVERVTGRPAEVAEPVAVNLVIADETLLAGDNSPAVVERLRADSGGGGAGTGRWGGDRRAVAGDAAAALPAPEVGCAGGDGVAVAAASRGDWRLHRAAGSDLPHPLL